MRQAPRQMCRPLRVLSPEVSWRWRLVRHNTRAPCIGVKRLILLEPNSRMTDSLTVAAFGVPGPEHVLLALKTTTTTTRTMSMSTKRATMSMKTKGARWLLQACLLATGVLGASAHGCTATSTATFELMVGFAYVSPAELMEARQGVMQLADCIDYCRHSADCQAINYETGLCVLFATLNLERPGVLEKSQNPVFTLYAEKVCLDRASCDRPWSFEVVPGYALNVRPRRRAASDSQASCMVMCLDELDFVCRSANFDSLLGECQLNELDRFSLAAPVPASGSGFAKTRGPLVEKQGVLFLESNCVPPAHTHAAAHAAKRRVCNFTRIDGQILKTVDAVRENVTDLDACRALCVDDDQADFPCRTFDFDQTASQECRLSHLSSSSVAHLDAPYLSLPGPGPGSGSGSGLEPSIESFELSTCYDVAVECGPISMVARVTANKAFTGRLYAKSPAGPGPRPVASSCFQDVAQQLEFALELAYQGHGPTCGVRQDGPASYTADIVLQHHQHVVTSHDVGLSVRCAYSLAERSVGLGVQLQLQDALPPWPGTGPAAPWQDTTFVASPEVSMRITDRHGGDVRNAQVGDALSLRFHIADLNSPYQLFVRELIALDGVGDSEVLLIDSLGCPTDPTIMGPISAVLPGPGSGPGSGPGRTLQAPFDAFKFPGSPVVQFKALVTPCLPACEPVVCPTRGLDGLPRLSSSLGRRRRSAGVEQVASQRLHVRS